MNQGLIYAHWLRKMPSHSLILSLADLQFMYWAMNLRASKEIINLSDHCLGIPLVAAESLNVAVTAAWWP